MCRWRMLGLKLDAAFKFSNNLFASLVARLLNTDKSKRTMLPGLQLVVKMTDNVIFFFFFACARKISQEACFFVYFFPLCRSISAAAPHLESAAFADAT